MNLLLLIPLSVRLAALFVIGAAIGTQVNRGIYRLAWHARQIGPWSQAHEKAPPRHWYDRLPIVGWVFLARESSLHGAGYWFRPLMIEFSLGAGLALLYWWETLGALTPTRLMDGNGMPMPIPLQGPVAIHAQFLAHAVLICVMAVATFIDVDEKTIPDEITIGGTLLGLLCAALLPMSLLPIPVYVPPVWQLGHLMITSPHDWWRPLDGTTGLIVGLACFLAWWAAILPLTWFTRWGIGKALRYWMGSAIRAVWPRPGRPYDGSRLYLVVLLVGVGGISLAWLLQDAWPIAHWRALLTALVGMAVGGALLWGVRLVGSRALGQEAMGFGDVTLMAMIGTFVGWQSCLMIFFIAPFAGLVIAVGQWILTRRHDIWYGPFLCLGTLVTIVCWNFLWNEYGHAVFWMGWFVPIVLVVMLIAMWAMLTVWRGIKERLFYAQEEAE